MRQNSQPIVKDLVLVGGGHSHAIALKLFGMKPLAGVRITLISDTSHAPYSGMLPGHVARLYDFDECHIDLRRLCRFAQAQFYLDRAIALDLENNWVICAEHSAVAFDVVSMDIGSTPATTFVPGASEYAIAAKPVPQFLHAWNQFLTEIATNPSQSRTVGIVGGGAGGVELALSMRGCFDRMGDRNIQILLFHRSKELLPSHNSWVSSQLEKILKQKQIQLFLETNVSRVTPKSIQCDSGLEVECDRVFWVTQASAPDWLKASGLATDERGFIAVNRNLQSLSHPQVFATGDVATMVDFPRPKAGVFAVRQGKPLFENLQRYLLGNSLKPYVPQKRWLGLIGTGDKRAIASWGSFGFGPTSWLWNWKDSIDRKFMQRFDVGDQSSSMENKLNHQLLTQNSELKTQNSIQYCAGCGSKVGSTVLERVLTRLQGEFNLGDRADIWIGLNSPDDAAVVSIPAGKLVVHTIDHFRSLISDPFIFGQITANHCLSDLFAMGAIPQSALAVVTLPYAIPAKTEETLYQLLSGAIKILSESQTALIGGHTTEGAELAFGLACNGLIEPNQILTKGGMQPGDLLVLTKALGTGTLFAAEMQYKAKGWWIDSAVKSMLQSNHQAASILMKYGATACTDITGFGLLGHVIEMVKASQVNVELNLEAIPALEGATETLQQEIFSSLHPQNLQAANFIVNLSEVNSHSLYPLLFDPQTAGGLLASIPEDNADACLTALKNSGYIRACVIGRVTSGYEHQPIKIML